MVLSDQLQSSLVPGPFPVLGTGPQSTKWHVDINPPCEVVAGEMYVLNLFLHLHLTVGECLLPAGFLSLS
jgi:hypothetical protein